MDKQDVYDVLNKAYFSEDCHEKESLEELRKMLDGASFFLDVGASLGQFSRAAAATLANSRARIVGIEADPIRFEELERNFAKWSEEFGVEMTALHGAVSATEEPLTFYTKSSNESGSLYVKAEGESQETDLQEVKVPGIKLDKLVEKFGGDPDLVKMDIEGGEAAAIAGAEAILGRGKTSFWIELHSWGSHEGVGAPKFVREAMARHGYKAVGLHGKVFFARSLKPGYALKALKRKVGNLLRGGGK